jgi:hypothetical protein
MTKYYIGLEVNAKRLTVFGEDRGDGKALAESGYDFVAGPYATQAEATREMDMFYTSLKYGG